MCVTASILCVEWPPGYMSDRKTSICLNKAQRERDIGFYKYRRWKDYGIIEHRLHNSQKNALGRAQDQSNMLNYEHLCI